MPMESLCLPLPMMHSQLDLAKATSDLSTLVDLVVQAGLADILSEAGPYTFLFSPKNEAFLELLENKTTLPALTDGLSLTTVQGEELTSRSVGNTVFTNYERIIIPNILANNGIIHVINRSGVLIPEESGIEQAPGAISNDNITDSIRTIPSAETIRPKDINLDGEFEPCSICLSLINTELIFDFDFILISVMPCCLLKLMKL